VRWLRLEASVAIAYQSDPETRKRINAGEMEYMDIHLAMSRSTWKTVFWAKWIGR